MRGQGRALRMKRGASLQQPNVLFFRVARRGFRVDGSSVVCYWDLHESVVVSVNASST